MTTKIKAAMADADMATQAELTAEELARLSADSDLDLRLDVLELPGRVVQVVNVMSGAVATGTTIIPYDDTIPQITEGNEYMTLAITPRSATSRLRIDVVFHGGASVSARLAVALFQDATANALAAVEIFIDATSGGATIPLTHFMTAGTTSATTFRVRAGMNVAGTTTFNGAAGTRLYGGVSASSITITEISA